MGLSDLVIDPEFRALIPPLSSEERAQLEANLLADGCRDPLVVWRGVLLDGHNRYAICQEHGLDFVTVEQACATRDDAKIWIIQHQFGRRNLALYTRAELVLTLEPLIAARAKANLSAGGGDRKSPLQNSAKAIDRPVDTRQELARMSGVSHDTITKAKVIAEHAPDDAKARLRRGESSIHREHSALVRAERRRSMRAKLEEVAAREIIEPTGQYDVIVIDPPWPTQKIERDQRPNQVAFDYPTMTESELEALDLPCADDCHVWVWTTQKFLPMAFRLLPSWNLKYVCCFVWHKPGGFQPFGLPQYNCEFVLYARRGTPSFLETTALSACFTAPRGSHTEKPAEFYDSVRRVTAGRRLDMFNRRKIDGFDGWGKEAP